MQDWTAWEILLAVVTAIIFCLIVFFLFPPYPIIPR